MDVIITKLLEWGPGGLLAAFFGYMLLKAKDREEVLLQRIHDLQEKRVSEGREDVKTMTAALATSSDAMDTQTQSILNLTRVVELAGTRGGAR